MVSFHGNCNDFPSLYKHYKHRDNLLSFLPTKSGKMILLNSISLRLWTCITDSEDNLASDITLRSGVFSLFMLLNKQTQLNELRQTVLLFKTTIFHFFFLLFFTFLCYFFYFRLFQVRTCVPCVQVATPPAYIWTNQDYNKWRSVAFRFFFNVNSTLLLSSHFIERGKDETQLCYDLRSAVFITVHCHLCVFFFFFRLKLSRKSLQPIYKPDLSTYTGKIQHGLTSMHTCRWLVKRGYVFLPNS